MKIYIQSFDLKCLGGSGISLNGISESLTRLGNIIWKTDKLLPFETLKKWKPDIIISQQWATKDASKTAKKLGIPFVMRVAGPKQYEHFFPNSNSVCDLVIFNTKEQYDLAKNKIGDTQYTIVHSTIFPEKCTYIGNCIKNKILLIGTELLKGWDIFINIALKNQNLQFLWVTDVNTSNMQLPQNLTVMVKQKDIKPIYGQTKIILVPSVRETYGRVCIEAMYNGIPVIASDVPGIRESTDNKAIYIKDRKNIDEWSEKIRNVLANYKKYSEISLEVSKSKDQMKQIVTLNNMLRNLII